MSIFKVRAALESAVAAMTPALATAWENKNFVPVPGTPYQKVFLLPAKPENPTFGDGFYREVGLLQITLSYPSSGMPRDGTGAASSRAEVIRSVFKRGTTFVKDDVLVTISGTPEVKLGTTFADRYEVPVRIPYFANLISQ